MTRSGDLPGVAAPAADEYVRSGKGGGFDPRCTRQNANYRCKLFAAQFDAGKKSGICCLHWACRTDQVETERLIEWSQTATREEIDAAMEAHHRREQPAWIRAMQEQVQRNMKRRNVNRNNGALLGARK